MSKNKEKTEPAVDAENPKDEQLEGRSVFLIETIPAGVSVRTAFLTGEEKLLQMPAVFPNLTYALNQIDQLRNNVIQHFEQAAQVGAQVISEHARSQIAAGPKDVEDSQSDTQASADAE